MFSRVACVVGLCGGFVWWGWWRWLVVVVGGGGWWWWLVVVVVVVVLALQVHPLFLSSSLSLLYLSLLSTSLCSLPLSHARARHCPVNPVVGVLSPDKESMANLSYVKLLKSGKALKAFRVVRLFKVTKLVKSVRSLVVRTWVNGHQARQAGAFVSSSYLG